MVGLSCISRSNEPLFMIVGVGVRVGDLVVAILRGGNVTRGSSIGFAVGGVVVSVFPEVIVGGFVVGGGSEHEGGAVVSGVSSVCGMPKKIGQGMYFVSLTGGLHFFRLFWHPHENASKLLLYSIDIVTVTKNSVETNISCILKV